MPQTAEPVTILVVRSGGVAGLRRAWRVLAEGADAAGWVTLVEACPWHESASVRSGAPGADRFAWEVTAALGNAARAADQRVVLAESDVVGPWRELIDAVRDRGEPCAADVP